MSEYQRYEFYSIDRELTEKEQAELQRYSRRAAITAHSATYTYNFGDFGQKPEKLLEKYFDVATYINNFGINQVWFKFPLGSLDVAPMMAYTTSTAVEITQTPTAIIVSIRQQEETPDYFQGDPTPITDLIPLHADLLNGDWRALYVGWMQGVMDQLGHRIVEVSEGHWKYKPTKIEDGEDVSLSDLEPPVPPNLGRPTRALLALADVFYLDPDCIHAAARNSPATPVFQLSPEQIESLSEAEAKAMLSRILSGGASAAKQIQHELHKRFAPPVTLQTDRRTVKALLVAIADEYNKQAEKEREKAAKEHALKMEELAKREESVWQQLEPLREVRRYPELVNLLLELRALAVHRGTMAAFSERVAQFKTAVSVKSTLYKQLKDAGL